MTEKQTAPDYIATLQDSLAKLQSIKATIESIRINKPIAIQSSLDLCIICTNLAKAINKLQSYANVPDESESSESEN